MGRDIRRDNESEALSEGREPLELAPPALVALGQLEREDAVRLMAALILAGPHTGAAEDLDGDEGQRLDIAEDFPTRASPTGEKSSTDSAS